MFPYYVPVIIGLLCSSIAVHALAHRGLYRRPWMWIAGLLASLLLWLPGLVLFVAIPHIWPQVNNGGSSAYYALMGWQIAWIFLGIPVGLIACILFMAIGSARRAELGSAARRV